MSAFAGGPPALWSGSLFLRHIWFGLRL